MRRERERLGTPGALQVCTPGSTAFTNSPPRTQERLCSDLGDGLVVVYFYLSSCGVCKYVQPAIEEACMRLGACASGGDQVDTTLGPRVAIVKHSLRDERDDATDLGRLYGIKVAPSFAIFQGATLMDSWSGGSRQKLYDMIDKHRHRHSN